MKEADFSYADDAMPPMARGLIRLVEAATGQRELRRLYLHNRRHGVAGECFFAAAVRALRLNVQFDATALAAVPRTGPVVVVANHPFGVLDGIVICWLIGQARPDFLVLAHAALLRAPEVVVRVLPIDFAATDEARRHLDEGGCIVVFPAGGISTAPDRLGRRRAVDAPWQPFAAQMIRRSRATVVPVFFEGQNSRLFQVASHLGSALRLSLIFREVKRRVGTAMNVAVGTPLPFASMPSNLDRQELADHLRAVTYRLAPTLAGLPDARPPGFWMRLAALWRRGFRAPSPGRRPGAAACP